MPNKWKLSREEKQELFESIQKQIEFRGRLMRFRLYLFVSIAACIILLLFLSYPIHKEKKEDNSEEGLLTDVVDTTEPVKDVQLVLGNQEIITIGNDVDIKYDEKGEIIVDTGSEQLKAPKISTEDKFLNTLIVPKGKRSSLTLADGTRVWVNSGSTLRFPSHFNTPKREIWLEGEIYIEVAKDESHPFQVNTSRMQIDVTGTRFNVTAYEEDSKQYVVLVDGGVSVNIEEERVKLLPNHILSVEEYDISTKKINPYDYISWKDGVLQFYIEPLSHILNRLSRYYDLSIACNEDIKSIQCTGKLVLFDSIDEVLNTICNTIPVVYFVENEQILIQRK